LVNVGQNTTLGDGDVAEKLVQFLIVADGQLKMTGDDTGLLVVTGGVTGQLEDFSSQVLKDGSQVDGSTWDALEKRSMIPDLTRLTGTNTLSVVALSEQTVDTTDWECETSLGRPAEDGS
jgi:hypothetical protein